MNGPESPKTSLLLHGGAPQSATRFLFYSLSDLCFAAARDGYMDSSQIMYLSELINDTS